MQPRTPRERRLRDGVTPGSTIILPRSSRLKIPKGVRPRNSRWLWIAIAILIPVLVLCFQIGVIADAIGAKDLRVDRPTPVVFNGFTALIIGVDDRKDGNETAVRSDTLMLLRVQPRSGGVSLLSIPRDTRVMIRGRGQSKINAAYAYGYLHPQELYSDNVSQQEAGMALAAETVEEFVGIRNFYYRVDYVIQINFAGFARLIDALGGVTIDVPKHIIDETYPTEDYGVMRVEFLPGLQHLDGAQALIYARTRHADSDFGRIQRQQQVTQAVIAAVRQTNIVQWWRIINDAPQIVGGSIRTTMPMTNPMMIAAWLATFAQIDPQQIPSQQISPKTVTRYTVDGSDLLWDGGDVQRITTAWLQDAGASTDPATVPLSADMVTQFRQTVDDSWRDASNYVRTLLGMTTSEGAASVQVFNASRVQGVARRVSDQLRSLGLVTEAPGDILGDIATTTIIYDVNNHPKQAASIALLIPGKIVHDKLPANIQSNADIVIVIGTDNAK